MYAVIETGGKQYRVTPGELLQVERLDRPVGSVVEFDRVLAVGGDQGLVVGVPHVERARVSAEVIAQSRGKKVIAFKKRRRKNSRRTRGHRQELTTIKITQIAAA
jgi:large subunit ribosomal protein L21